MLYYSMHDMQATRTSVSLSIQELTVWPCLNVGINENTTLIHRKEVPKDQLMCALILYMYLIHSSRKDITFLIS